MLGITWHNLTEEPGVYLTRSGGALIVLLATLVIGHFLAARAHNTALRSGLGPNPSLLIARTVRFATWVLGCLWILAIFSVPFTALAAVVGVATLAISLSLQDLLKNLIAGIYLLAERPFHIGDRITVSGVTGVIEDIQMRVTYLRSDHGERVVMPNQTVFTQVIVNNTVAGAVTRSVSIQAPTSLTPDEVRQRVGQAVQGVPGVATSPQPVLEAVSMGGETSTWLLTLWLGLEQDYTVVLLALGKALPEATVQIPPAT